jgi:hypothetical protein
MFAFADVKETPAAAGLPGRPLPDHDTVTMHAIVELPIYRFIDIP